MSMIQFLLHLTTSLGNDVHDLLIEDHLGGGVFLASRLDLPICDLAGPRIEIATNFKVLEFLANGQAGFLKNVFGITS